MTFIINEDHETPIRRRYTKYFRRIYSTKVLKRRLPILEWLPKYSAGALIQDVIAGLTVGLTAIPQGLAYAVIAGLPPEYGLYSSLTAGVIYALLGTCKDISVGPTAILSAITARYVADYSAEFAVLVGFLSGVLILCMAVLRLRFLVEFISLPVISGFTTAAAIQVSTSQITPLLGLEGRSGNYFADSVWNIMNNIRTIKMWDTLLGLLTVVLLILLQKLGNGCGPKDAWAKKLRWLTSIARNTIVVIAGMILAYIFSRYIEITPFTLIGEINAGLPQFGLPPFKAVITNETYSFGEMVEILGAKSVVIPFVSILEMMVLSKVFSDGQVDVTQQMVALGICNIIGSFGKSMPITGSFSRTALNQVSNAQTPLGGILTSILIILSLTLLTSSFTFIPKSSLAALIILAMFAMISVTTIQHLWKNSKKELVVLMITLSVSLGFGLEFGIIAGVLTEAVLLMYKQARPDFDRNISYEKHEGKSLIILKLSNSVLYCAAEYLRRELLKLASYNDFVIVINGVDVHNIDYTVASNLMSFTKDLEKKSRQVVLVNFNPSIVKLCVDIYPESIDKFTDDKNCTDFSFIDLVIRND